VNLDLCILDTVTNTDTVADLVKVKHVDNRQ